MCSARGAEWGLQLGEFSLDPHQGLSHPDSCTTLHSKHLLLSQQKLEISYFQPLRLSRVGQCQVGLMGLRVLDLQFLQSKEEDGAPAAFQQHQPSATLKLQNKEMPAVSKP